MVTPLHQAVTGEEGERRGTADKQRRAVVLIERQAVGERADGVRVGAAALASFEGADGLGGDAGALGELLLGQRA